MKQTSSNRSLSLSMCFWTNAQREREKNKIFHFSIHFDSNSFICFANEMTCEILHLRRTFKRIDFEFYFILFHFTLRGMKALNHLSLVTINIRVCWIIPFWPVFCVLLQRLTISLLFQSTECLILLNWKYSKHDIDFSFSNSLNALRIQ